MKHFNIKYEIRHRIGDTRDFKTITNNKIVEARDEEHARQVFYDLRAAAHGDSFFGAVHSDNVEIVNVEERKRKLRAFISGRFADWLDLFTLLCEEFSLDMDKCFENKKIQKSFINTPLDSDEWRRELRDLVTNELRGVSKYDLRK
jgi:hypothetical protein